MKNKVGREISDKILDSTNYKPFETTEIGHPIVHYTGHDVRVTKGDDKLVDSLDDVIKNNLKDGMTISFHHHFRNGDFVFNMVMDKIIKMGYKDLTLAPSSLTGVMNDKVIEAIKAGTITNITSSGMRGSLGEAVSHGLLKNPVIFRSHGNRARSIENGNIKIDVAFIGVPNSDRMGNANGMNGESALGIQQTQVDYVVKIDKVGDPDRIGSGATRFTKDPKELKIAKMVNDVIVNSPYFKEGFSFQTGTGGAALAVTRFLRQAMIDNNITASFTCGGTTSPIVKL